MPQYLFISSPLYLTGGASISTSPQVCQSPYANVRTSTPILHRSTLHGSRKTLFVSPLLNIRSSRNAATQQLTMGLFGLGFPELAVIGVVAALIFGPSKIADLGKDMGSLAGSVKKATSEFKDAMDESLQEAEKELEENRKKKKLQEGSTTDEEKKKD